MAKQAFEVKTLKAGEMFEAFPGLGRDQAETGARAGGSEQWELSSIIASIESKGWDDMAGPMPLYRVGDQHPRIGNRRCTAMGLLAQRLPNKWAEVKIKFRVYAKDTPDEVMDEIVASEIRSTKAHTRRDIVSLICKYKQRNPNASQRQCAEHVGAEVLRQLNTFKDGALELGPDGILRIKSNLPDTKVFRQKDVIMEGIAAAKALPEVRELFLNPTEKRYINADELYAANQAFEADVKQMPSLAACSTVAEIAERFPSSALAAQVAPVLLDGRDTKPGPRPGGKRALSTAARKQAQQSLGKLGAFNCLFQFVDGLEGAQGEDALGDLETVAEGIAILLNIKRAGEHDEARDRVNSTVAKFAARVDVATAERNAKLKEKGDASRAADVK